MKMVPGALFSPSFFSCVCSGMGFPHLTYEMCISSPQPTLLQFTHSKSQSYFRMWKLHFCLEWLMMSHGDKKRSGFWADPPPILQSMGKEGGSNASEGNFHFYSIFLNFYPSILFLSQWGMNGMDNTCKSSFHFYIICFGNGRVMFKVWPVLVTFGYLKECSICFFMFYGHGGVHWWKRQQIQRSKFAKVL